MFEKRRLTKQLKKLKEIFSDILVEAQLSEIDAVIANVDKGFNIIKAIEGNNGEKRAGE